MKPLAPDEKSALVLVYTRDMLVRGELVLKDNLRVNIWLRTQGVPDFIHIIKPQIVLFGGSAPKTISYAEFFIPTIKLVAFHLAPPSQEPLDYEESEMNRAMVAIDVMVGTFLIKGKIRISSQADIAANLDVTHMAWMSIYDASISNPTLPQFNLQVPMLLVNPAEVNFAIE